MEFGRYLGHERHLVMYSSLARLTLTLTITELKGLVIEEGSVQNQLHDQLLQRRAKKDSLAR